MSGLGPRSAPPPHLLLPAERVSVHLCHRHRLGQVRQLLGAVLLAEQPAVPHVQRLAQEVAHLGAGGRQEQEQEGVWEGVCVCGVSMACGVCWVWV